MLKVMVREFDDFLPTCFSLYPVNEVSQSLLDTQLEVPSSTIGSDTEIRPGIQDTSSACISSDFTQQHLTDPNPNAVNEINSTGNDTMVMKPAEVALMGAGVDPLSSGEFVFIFFFLNFQMCDFLPCVIFDVF